MKRRWHLSVALLALGLLAGCSVTKPAPARVPAGEGTLVVDIEGFRSDQGEVIVSLFSSSRGFPEEMGEALENAHAGILDRRARVVFEKIPYGTYALSVLHDENRNGRMETGLLGMPLEGHGASNDAHRSFAPPKFRDARFLLDTTEKLMKVRMEYSKKKGPWD